MEYAGLLKHRLPRALTLVGPGLFCVGYTIGPGTVTKQAQAAAESGLVLLALVPLGGLLFWTMMEAFGRYTAVTGETVLHGFRTQFPGGRWLALLIIAGVVLGQWTGLPVLVTLISHLLADGLRVILPAVAAPSRGADIAVATILMVGIGGLLSFGRFSLLEKTMIALTALMVAGFVGAAGVIQLAAESGGRGPVPPVPGVGGGTLAIPVLLGAALAMPTFLVRSLLVKHAQWGDGRIEVQRRDARVAAVVVIIIAAAVVAGVAGALERQALPTGSILVLTQGIGAAFGRLGAMVFALGVLGAGLSSIIPMTMVLPLLIGDYCEGRVDLRTPRFRGLAALGCAVGVSGPLFGERLVPFHRIASLISQALVVPLVVAGIILLLNRGELMGAHRAGFWLNAGLTAAFAGSLVLAGSALTALWARLA